jgi:hypothetical protein
MAAMRTAADFYFHTGLYDDASRLYRRIFKSQSSFNRSPDHTVLFTNLILAGVPDRPDWCSSESVCASLRKGAESISPDIETFLLYMLSLEAIRVDYGRYWTIPAWEQNGMLQKLHVSLKKSVAQLPSHCRSLDLLVFKYGIRILESIRLKRRALLPGQTDPFQSDDALMFASDLEEIFLHRVPGPFMLNEQGMGNGCLRSNFTWCVIKIENAGELSMSRVVPIYKDLRVFELFQNSRGPGAFYLFCFLWECFQVEAKETESLEIEEKMGLTPAHFLTTICRMIFKHNPQLRDVWSLGTRWSLTWYMRTISGFSSRYLYNDFLLARDFLEAFRWEEHGSKDVIYSLGASGSQRYSRTDALRSLLESYVTIPGSDGVER